MLIEKLSNVCFLCTFISFRPGISSNPEIDKIVNDQCSDADVHIFVGDSVASITTEERL